MTDENIVHQFLDAQLKKVDEQLMSFQMSFQNIDEISAAYFQL